MNDNELIKYCVRTITIGLTIVLTVVTITVSSCTSYQASLEHKTDEATLINDPDRYERIVRLKMWHEQREKETDEFYDKFWRGGTSARENLVQIRQLQLIERIARYRACLKMTAMQNGKPSDEFLIDLDDVKNEIKAEMDNLQSLCKPDE